MRKLVFRPDEEDAPPFTHGDDVDRMVRILADAGYEASPEDVRLAWESYSDSYCATWLILEGDDQAVLAHLLAHLDEA